MSSHFDLVLNCHLRRDLSDENINVLRCLTSNDFEPPEEPMLELGDFNVWEMFSNYHFLRSRPEEEVISNLQRILIGVLSGEKLYQYSLQFSGRAILDDIYFVNHLPFVHWLATISEEGFIGYSKETLDFRPELFYVKNRQIEHSP